MTELRTHRVEEIGDEEVESEIDSLGGAREGIELVRERIRLWREQNSTEEFPKFPVVTFLGTGSTVPSKYRNLSAILIETQKGDLFIKSCSMV